MCARRLAIQESGYPKDYFSFNRFMLRYAGLWAPENSKPLVKILYFSYATLVFVFVNVYFTGTEFVSLIQTYREPHDMIKNINFALTHLMGAIKCVFWFCKGDKLIELMNVLEYSQYTYESSGKTVVNARDDAISSEEVQRAYRDKTSDCNVV